ncbi:uncharacterized protein [Taeniopygia guttata]|uniref:uncharacterized protein isoform X10 n=1 Tax=Taeniopygia guttata TaxID=59729 RepID=UPI003BB86D75
MGESLSQWEAAEAGPAHSTPPVSPILSLARGDAPDASSPFQFGAATPPRSYHLWLGQEPELSPGVPKCPQQVTPDGGEGWR